MLPVGLRDFRSRWAGSLQSVAIEVDHQVLRAVRGIYRPSVTVLSGARKRVVCDGCASSSAAVRRASNPAGSGAQWAACGPRVSPASWVWSVSLHSTRRGSDHGLSAGRRASRIAHSVVCPPWQTARLRQAGPPRRATRAARDGAPGLACVALSAAVATETQARVIQLAVFQRAPAGLTRVTGTVENAATRDPGGANLRSPVVINPR